MQLPTGIYQRGKVYWFANQVDGVRTFESLKTKELAKAITRAADIKRRGAIQSQTLTASIEKYLAQKKQTKEFSRKTYDCAKSALNIFAAFSGNPATLTEAHVRAWRGDLLAKLAEPSVHSYLRILRSFCSWRVSPARIDHEHAFGTFKLKRVENPAKTVFCTAQQRDDLIKAVHDADFPEWKRDMLLFVFHCGFHLGMRKNEIIQARADWFHPDFGKLGAVQIKKTTTFNPKGRRRRTIPMTVGFKKFILKYGFREPFMLMPGVKQGRSIYRYDFELPFQTLVASRDMPWVTAHVMRHTFASLLLNQGVSLFKVAKWLGDTLKVAEDHYAHLIADDDDIDRGHTR
jgi:integrase